MPGLYFGSRLNPKSSRTVRSAPSTNAVGFGSNSGTGQRREQFHVAKEAPQMASVPNAQQPMVMENVSEMNMVPVEDETVPVPVPPPVPDDVPPQTAPEDSNTARLPGIIPQTSTIPNSTVPYFRAAWTGEAAVGKGFVRETSQFKPTALNFDSAPPENIVTTQNQRFSVISKSREYAKNLTVGASLAVEAYGVEVSASVEVNKSTQFSANSVTVSLQRSYKSDPILFADPVSTRVELDDTAARLLREKGPKAFHEAFGTHYIQGYTIGGIFSGFVQIRYSSKERAESAKVEVEAAVSKMGIEAEATFNFDQEVSEKTQSESTRASYNAIGWNVAPLDYSGNVKAPPTVIDMKTLLEASNQMETDDGQRMEAVLAFYEDLPDYKQNLAEYRYKFTPEGEKDEDEKDKDERERREGDRERREDDRTRREREERERRDRQERRERSVQMLQVQGSQPGKGDSDMEKEEFFETLPKEKFMLISQLLNEEFLCLDFLDRAIDDLLIAVTVPAELEAEAHGMRVRAFLLQQQIRNLFSIDADARENWLDLAAYIDYVSRTQLTSGQVPDPNAPILISRKADRGRRLANAIFECEKLEEQFDELVKNPNVQFPSVPKSDS